MDEPLAKPENPHAQEQPGIAPDAPPARRRIAAWLVDRDAVRGLRPLLDPETLELEPLAGNEDPVEALRASPPDLILLDADAPGADPRETCLTLRADPATAHLPIVVVASVAGDEDRIAMLELGADDFLAKPYSTRELVLRMRAVLRRHGGRSSPGARRERVLRAGPLQLYADEHRLVVGGREVFLTPTECRLMYLLALRVGRIQHRDSLLHEIWGRRAGKTTRTLDVHVHRLRRKLEPEGERLETVVGIGYRLRP